MNKENLPKRKNIRWDKQDYSHPGEYMITVCTKDMKQILSRITVNPQTVGTGVLDRPYIQLTHYGKIADKYINQLNDFYSNINVIKYVIMPNHIHLLLQIPDDESGRSGTPVPTGECCTNDNGANSTVSKFVSTFKRFVHRDIGEKIFQRSYHDHVIRDENDFLGAVNYMENNPTEWTKSKIHPTKPRFCGDPEKS
ncbi:MAG: hypothetical protein J6A85_03465 [Clostridia bacterium]|nr:hypothetical protein [Clostridia bacterium]